MPSGAVSSAFLFVSRYVMSCAMKSSRVKSLILSCSLSSAPSSQSLAPSLICRSWLFRKSRSIWTAFLVSSRLSCPVAVASASAIRASTRFCRFRYCSRSFVGQKLIMCTSLARLPIRSIRPNRCISRVGFQWMS